MDAELQQVSDRVRRIREANRDEVAVVVDQMDQLPAEERALLVNAIAACGPQPEIRKLGQAPSVGDAIGDPGTPAGNLFYAFSRLSSAR